LEDTEDLIKILQRTFSGRYLHIRDRAINWKAYDAGFFFFFSSLPQVHFTRKLCVFEQALFRMQFICSKGWEQWKDQPGFFFFFFEVPLLRSSMHAEPYLPSASAPGRKKRRN